jgi:hypothetical protein
MIRIHPGSSEVRLHNGSVLVISFHPMTSVAPRGLWQSFDSES